MQIDMQTYKYNFLLSRHTSFLYRPRIFLILKNNLKPLPDIYNILRYSFLYTYPNHQVSIITINIQGQLPIDKCLLYTSDSSIKGVILNIIKESY